MLNNKFTIHKIELDNMKMSKVSLFLNVFKIKLVDFLFLFYIEIIEPTNIF